MTPSETRFKLAVCALVREGRHPTGHAIHMELGYKGLAGIGILGDYERRWLRDDLGVKSVADCQLFCCKQGGDFLMDCVPVETKS